MSALTIGRRAKIKIIVFALLVMFWYICASRPVSNNLSKLTPDDWRGEKFILVSAYYSIGKFIKPGNKARMPSDYFSWMTKFSFLNNHLVFFSDAQEILDYMSMIRGNKTTTTILLDRWQLVGFKNIDKIKKIFKLPGFGLHPEETGNYNYSAIMHSKHDMIRRAIYLFSNESSYFSWVDIGLFRYTRPYTNFEFRQTRYVDNTRVMMTQSFRFRDLPIENIIKHARTWVSGAIIAGHADAMLNFCNVYGNFFFKLLSMELIATDEQSIYALYSSEGQKIFPNSVKLSVFQCDYFGLYLLFTNVPSFDQCP